MRLSRYFMPILKENPKEAEIVSHRLMLRAGMIRQQSQGIYSWLPLGKRVLDKVNNIIREEQNRAGAGKHAEPFRSERPSGRRSRHVGQYAAPLEMFRRMRGNPRYCRKLAAGKMNRASNGRRAW